MTPADLGLLVVVWILSLAWREIRFQRRMKEGWKDIALEYQDMDKDKKDD